MSDISFNGLAGAIVGLAMLALAAIGLIAEVIIARLRSTPADAGRTRLYLCPVGYGAIGAIVLVISDGNSVDWQIRMDTVAIPVAIAGLVAWAAIRIHVARSLRARHPTREGEIPSSGRAM